MPAAAYLEDFDSAWSFIRDTYAYFHEKDVDWPRVRELLRPRVDDALHCLGTGAVAPALRWRVLAKTLQEEPADQVIGFAGFWQLAIRKECVP